MTTEQDERVGKTWNVVRRLSGEKNKKTNLRRLPNPTRLLRDFDLKMALHTIVDK